MTDQMTAWEEQFLHDAMEAQHYATPTRKARPAQRRFSPGFCRNCGGAMATGHETWCPYHDAHRTPAATIAHRNGTFERIGAS